MTIETVSAGGVMVSRPYLSAVDSCLEPLSGQTNHYKMGTCCFSTKQTALMTKSKDCFAQNHDNVSPCGDMSIRGLLFQ